MTDHYEQASAEARQRGMAFLVDGKHVNADRVMILSVPDTIGPISDMRKAKVEAQEALASMRGLLNLGDIPPITVSGVLSDIHRNTPQLRDLRKWHMKQVAHARQCEKVSEGENAANWAKVAGIHRGFVQALNVLFGDNDQLGEPA